jgi:hypothetical protein
MGLFDSPSSFFGGIGDGIKGIFETAKSGINDVWHAGLDLIRAPGELAKHGIDKGSELIKSVTGEIKDTVVGASKEVGGALQGVSQSFAWPLAAAAAGVGALYILKK